MLFEIRRSLATIVRLPWRRPSPAACRLDFTDHSRALGARERAVDIPEQRARQDIARQPTAIQGDERSRRALPALVDGAGEHLLADPNLTL